MIKVSGGTGCPIPCTGGLLCGPYQHQTLCQPPANLPRFFCRCFAGLDFCGDTTFRVAAAALCKGERPCDGCDGPSAMLSTFQNTSILQKAEE